MGEGGGRSAPVGESAGWKTNLTAVCRRRIVEKLLDAMRKSLPNSVTEVLAGLQRLVMRFEEKIYNEATSSTCVANCSAVRGPDQCSNTASTTMQSQIQIKHEQKVPIPLVKQYESCQNSSWSARMKEYAQNSSNNSLNEKGDQLSDLINARAQKLFGRQSSIRIRNNRRTIIKSSKSFLHIIGTRRGCNKETHSQSYTLIISWGSYYFYRGISCMVHNCLQCWRSNH